MRRYHIHYYKLLYVLVYQVRGSPDNLQSLHHTSPYIAVDHLSPGMGSYTASSPPFSGGGMAAGGGTAGRGWWEGGGGEGTTLTYPPGGLSGGLLTCSYSSSSLPPCFIGS